MRSFWVYRTGPFTLSYWWQSHDSVASTSWNTHWQVIEQKQIIWMKTKFLNETKIFDQKLTFWINIFQILEKSFIK